MTASGAPQLTIAPDVFDTIYKHWAEVAIGNHQDPPSRERWDQIVLLLLQSQDPARIARYKRLDTIDEGGLGSDAYELWSKMPNYMPNRSVPARTQAEVAAYEQATLGSMRKMMEARGLGPRYAEIVEAYGQYMQERRAKARRGQATVLIIGCAGITLIVFMALTVLLVIALRMNG